MYICARTLTRFFAVWKSQVIGEETKMKNTLVTKTSQLCICAVMLAMTIGAAQRSFSQERKAIDLAPARGLPFNDGIVVGNTLYIAGQEGTDDGGKLAAGGIGPETTATLENIQKALKAAGFDLKDVVSVTVYLADIHEFLDLNKVYKSVMAESKPGRGMNEAAALVNNGRIEISAIAVKQK